MSSRCFREQGEHPTVGRNSTVCHITGFYFTYYHLRDCLRPKVWYALHTFFSIFQGNCFWHKYLDTFSYNFSIWLSFCMTKIPMSFFFFPNTCLIYWSIYFCYKTWHKFHRYLLLYYDYFCSPPFEKKVIIVFSNSFHRFSRSVLIADILCLLLNFAVCLFILFLLTCLFCRIPWDECSEYIRCDLDPILFALFHPSCKKASVFLSAI